MTKTKLSLEEKARYSRHLNIPQIGEAGQLRIKESSVLIVGAGGLGSAASLYLAAAGMGKIGIVDSDQVELSNLQRQILHAQVDIGRPKVDSARDRLTALNQEIEINTYHERISVMSDRTLFAEYPIVVDATDNFDTRYLLNEICTEMGKLFIYGAVYQFYGQMSVFDAAIGPCFRCVFRNEPSEEFSRANQEIGVASMLPGTIGTLQAMEALKQILKIGKPAVGRLILFDGLEMSFQEIVTKKDPACPVCGRTEKK